MQQLMAAQSDMQNQHEFSRNLIWTNSDVFGLVGFLMHSEISDAARCSGCFILDIFRRILSQYMERTKTTL